LQEVGQRREHINQLTDHIGVINARLEDMGSHVMFILKDFLVKVKAELLVKNKFLEK